ncbi:MAG TPA: AIR synthase family protein [Calditerricola sp.]
MGRFDTGKLPPELLQRFVLQRTGTRRPEVRLGAALGEDAAALDLGGDLCVAASDPITGAGRQAGWLAVHVNCNDIAATGAEPVGILLTVLLPEGATAADLEDIMAGAEEAARETGCQIIGGHTEVTPGLPQALVIATALGRAPRDRLVSSGGARPGDEIILTKWAGLEGTAILAVDFPDELAVRGVDAATLESAARLGRWLSVLPEARIAASHGAHAMHDVTEGGVLGAVYELLHASSVTCGRELGCQLEAAAIPVRPETSAICAALGADPLRLIGSGALVVATDRGDALVEELAAAGIPAARIGRVTAGGGRWVAGAGGERHPLEPPAGDELWRVRARLAAS